jgi:hypothetical protein
MAETPAEENIGRNQKRGHRELERRGYDVRGKAPAQIRKMLRARPYNHKNPLLDQGPIRE